MSVEFKPIGEIENEPKNGWFPLREAERNDKGYTKVGKVAWFPSQMPSNFEIFPAEVERMVTRLGFSLVVLRSFVSEQEKPVLSARDIDKNGAATIERVETKTSSEVTSNETDDEILYLDLDYAEILAQARSTPNFYQLPKRRQIQVLADHIETAIKSELFSVAQDKVKEGLINEGIFLSYIVMSIMAYIWNDVLATRYSSRPTESNPFQEIDTFLQENWISFLFLFHLMLRGLQAFAESLDEIESLNESDSPDDKGRKHRELLNTLLQHFSLLPKIGPIVKPLKQGIETRYLTKTPFIRSTNR